MKTERTPQAQPNALQKPRPRPANLKSSAPPTSLRPPARPATLGGGDQANAQTRARDNLQGQLQFPDRTSAAQQVARAGDPSVNELAAAIRNYPGSKTTSESGSREIAQAAVDAGRQFGVDPRQLLAVWARESQFNPSESGRNGRGLGQLTGTAVEELQRIGRGGRNGHRARVDQATFAMLRSPEARATFQRLGTPANRTNIRDNAMGSAAYLRLMMDVHNGNRTATLRAYNGAGGAIERAYPGHITNAYQQLFGGPMPATMQMR